MILAGVEQVDLIRLPMPAEACDTASHVAPRSDHERVLQGVWQQVLGLNDPPSVEADFFTELGGSSLQVLHQLQQYYPDSDQTCNLLLAGTQSSHSAHRGNPVAK